MPRGVSYEELDKVYATKMSPSKNIAADVNVVLADCYICTQQFSGFVFCRNTIKMTTERQNWVPWDLTIRDINREPIITHCKAVVQQCC